MQIKNALVAVLCSAILSAGLAIGLGAGGQADAAPGSTAQTLKQIKSELVKVNGALGTTNGELGDVNTELGDVNTALGNPTFLSMDITELLREICDNTAGTIC